MDGCENAVCIRASRSADEGMIEPENPTDTLYPISAGLLVPLLPVGTMLMLVMLVKGFKLKVLIRKLLRKAAVTFAAALKSDEEGFEPTPT